MRGSTSAASGSQDAPTGRATHLAVSVLGLGPEAPAQLMAHLYQVVAREEVGVSE